MWVLPFALVLGVKHAFDADHLVAVSNFLTRSKGVKESADMGISWALGHMLTASLITVAIFFLAKNMIIPLLDHFEIIVGIMLVIIGALGILMETKVIHSHTHFHRKMKRRHTHFHLHILGRELHIHSHLFGVGIVHGLASNDELFVLIVLTLGLASLPLMLAGVGIFSIGVMIGMTIFGALVSFPKLRWGTKRTRRAINVIVGAISLIYGGLLLAGIG